MSQHYTDQSLLRYVYGECSPEECKGIKESATEDMVLRDRIHQYRIVQEMLDTEQHEPSQTSIEIIMDYSQNVEEQLEASF